MAENPRLWKGFLPGCWTTSLVSVSVPTPTREDRGGGWAAPISILLLGCTRDTWGTARKRPVRARAVPGPGRMPRAPPAVTADGGLRVSSVSGSRRVMLPKSWNVFSASGLGHRRSPVPPNLRTGGPRCPSDTRDKATKYNRHHPPGLLRGWCGGGGEGAGAVTSALGGWCPGHRQGGPFLGFPQVMPGYERALSLPLGLAREQAGRLPLQSRASGSLFSTRAVNST